MRINFRGVVVSHDRIFIVERTSGTYMTFSNIENREKYVFLDRSLRVVVNGQTSEAHKINAGVPQGSLLGPTLFLLFINDLPDHIITSFVDIYADDTTMYGCTAEDLSDCDLAAGLSADLEQVVLWGKAWQVTFNSSKTKLLSFHTIH